MALQRKNQLHQENEELLKKLEWYGDITFELDVELGRRAMTLREVLELKDGSIVELKKTAGESVDVMVNNQLLATSEIVVIEDSFAIRVTDIIDEDTVLQKYLQGAYQT
ncbi:flagellar motor switch protein FliN [Desulfurispira natronophila]|uniref:Flagellar motor switch protein FliN n=1 Tax=Desulfurispira natronophila TaxID=682562 RepID=A0A7W7Y432_9BACT|nr:flagellar motor switch protein FliN/FliY [Desulfurispira natronophila]